MKHIVLVKFKEGLFSNEVVKCLKEDYEALSRVMPSKILSVSVRTSCVEREENMDVMIEMTLDSKESLESYLSHPIHIGIGEKLNSKVDRRISFDYEK